MPVIEARALRKIYGDGEARVEALRGIDLGVAPGEYVAIMGPSGSGKSTLLHLLSGIEDPTSGQVLVDGRDLATMTDDQRTILRRRRIGLIFQSFNLLPTLTAEENAAVPLLLAGEKRAVARQHAQEALAWVGLSQRRHHVPSALSGGEQQRVAIARALVIAPTILLADEPTGNLDTVAGQQVITMFRQLVDQRRQSVLLITHDARVAAGADRVLYLRDGILVGPSDDGVPPTICEATKRS
jgi:putative ABC transport system ATP-binding protein